MAGLTTGSSVGFNGIKVGEVQSFALDPEDARKVQVLVSVRDDTPVRENSRASIQSMGLTGGSGIQITPGTPDAPFLVATAENPVPAINADRGVGPGPVRGGLRGDEQRQRASFRSSTTSSTRTRSRSTPP